MAGWQFALAVFSLTLLSISAEPKHQVKEIQQLAQTGQGNPLLLNVDTSDNDFQAIAEMAMQELSSQKGSLYKIVQYLDAKAQVLEGILYMTNVFIGKTDCPASRTGPAAAGCKIIPSFTKSEFFMCHLVLWTPPAGTQGRVLTKECLKINL
ncbi:cystatin-like [Rhinoraja longicauda]